MNPVSADHELAFRPLAEADLPQLQRWLREPHVDRWWHGPQDLTAVRAKYLPRIDGTQPTRVFVMELTAVPIGWIQWYRWADYPEHGAPLGAPADSAGVDLAIGELALLGRGVGSSALRQFVEGIVFADAAIATCLSDPQTANQRSLRAFAKAGFAPAGIVQLKDEPFTRQIMRRDRTR